MKIFLVFIIGLTLANSQRTRVCTTSKRCGECSERDCNTDAECRHGLFCALAHQSELIAVGLDPNKAYCGPIGKKNNQHCYDPTKVGCNDDSDCPRNPNDGCKGKCNVTNRTCVYGPWDCHDKDWCTLDSENRLRCDDKNLCTIDSCILPIKKTNSTDRILGSCSYVPVNCDDGDVCTYDSCDPETGCTHSPNCDDGNPCTIDACDPILGCSHTPITCPTNEGCDVGTGQCHPMDSIIPCIVVTERSNLEHQSINDKWSEFRKAYPLRPFCLLQLPKSHYHDNEGYAKLFTPTNPDFLNDKRTLYAAVQKDYGNASLASDWLAICGYKNLPYVDYVAVFVEKGCSFSTTYGFYDFPKNVYASLVLLNNTLAAANRSWCSAHTWPSGLHGHGGYIPPDSNDWISPFTKPILTTEWDGKCA